jgi:hypothetical protein
MDSREVPVIKSPGRKFAVTGVVIALLAALYWHEMTKSSVREVDGQIISIDPAARTARLTVHHPKTGATIELAGDVPPDCDIRIDGRPARFDELSVGESVHVRGTIYRSGKLTANWVRVSRNPTGEETIR